VTISKTNRFNSGLVAICFVFTCGVVLLAVIANWPVYRNMQILTHVKEKTIPGLLAVENASATAGYAVVLIENSASAGSNLSLIEAEEQRPMILSQLSTGGSLTTSPQIVTDIDRLLSMTEDIFSSGSRWVDTVIQMDLAEIAPTARAFSQKKHNYEKLLEQVKQTTRADLNAVLAQMIVSSRQTIFLTILASLVTIPLVIMLQIKMSVDNAKLHRDLEQTLERQRRSLSTIEKQNQALSAAKIWDQETLRRLRDEIADHRITAQRLRSSERRTAQIIDFLPDPTFVIDRDGRVIAWNRAMEALTGVDADAMLGKGDYEYALPIYGERRPIMIDLVEHWDDKIADTYRQVRKKGAVLVSETKDPPFRDSRSQYLNTAGPLFDEKGRRVGAIETIRDITELRQAEEELVRLRNYLENIIDSMPSVLVGVDADGRVTQWNHQAWQQTGLTAEAARNQPLDAVFPHLSDEMARIHEAIIEQRVVTDSKRVRRSGEETRFEDVTIYPLRANGVAGAVVRVDDVTERVHLEEMMVQSEKMLMVGGLAAGMAHEINNPLAGILQNTQVIQSRLFGDLPANQQTAKNCGTTMKAIQAYALDRKLPEMMEMVVNSSMRAAKTVKDMLAFSRKSDAVREDCDLKQLLESTLELAAKDFDLKRNYDFQKIEVIRFFESDLPPILCEKNKIQQVFFNILKNGAQAMNEKAMAAGPGSAGDDYRPTFTLRLRREKSMLRVEIADNGPGIRESLRRRIFEPFFTTKRAGVGTGLGMSVSYFIVADNHGGTLDVESTPGAGTTFIIKLPIEKRAIEADDQNEPLM
jgi:PAS domain S-box-containing protein